MYKAIELHDVKYWFNFCDNVIYKSDSKLNLF